MIISKGGNWQFERIANVCSPFLPAGVWSTLLFYINPARFLFLGSSGQSKQLLLWGSVLQILRYLYTYV